MAAKSETLTDAGGKWLPLASAPSMVKLRAVSPLPSSRHTSSAIQALKLHSAMMASSPENAQRRADTAADYLVPKIGVFGVFGVPGPVGVRFQAGPQFLDRLEMGLFQGVLPLGGFALEAGRELAGEAAGAPGCRPDRRGPSSLWCRLGSRP